MFGPELRHAWRSICQRPMLSAAAIACLALGIGANTTIYSIASSALSPALPGIADPDRLVAVYRTHRGSCCGENSWPIYRELRDEYSVFAGVEAHFPLLSVTLAGPSEPETVWGQLVSENFFTVLGVRPLLGAAFAAGPSSRAPVIVISHSLWQRRFAADPAVIGRSVVLNTAAFSIVAVTPPGFRGPDLALAPDFWVPFPHIAQVMPQRPSLEDRDAPWLALHARLQPGVSYQQAQAALDVVARRLETSHRDTDEGRGLLAEPARSFYPAYRGAVVNMFAIVMAIVGLVLVVACVNVANILLARASGRRRDIAVRLALGAGRARLIREMLAESILLGAIGGSAGLLLASVLTRILTGIRLPLSVPFEFHAPLDGRVLAATAILSLATAFVFGLAPALGASRPDLVADLKGGQSGSTGSRVRVRDWLVAVQIAASVLLLSVSILFLRSLAGASAIDPGFATARLLVVKMDPRPYGEPVQFMNRLRDRLMALPGVTSSTYADIVPLGIGARVSNIKAAGLNGQASQSMRADTFAVGPDYFRTMGIRILRGAQFRDDGDGTERVAIVNELAASRLWPGMNPVGRELMREGVAHRIVAVVSNLKSRTIGEAQRPCLFVLFSQNRSQPIPYGLSLLVRSDADPLAMVSVVRSAIRETEPRLAVSNIRTMDNQLYDALVLPRTGAWLFGAFGLVGVLLTAAGIYGVVSFTVAGRIREFGIRSAIGARSADILRLVLRHGLTLAFWGSAVGLAAGVSIARFFGSLLYGVRTFDVYAFTVAPLSVIGVTLLACYLPARRASRVDPVVALRSE